MKKRKRNEEKPAVPVVNEFDKSNNGLELYLKIKKIDSVPHLLNYLTLNPAIKTLYAKIDTRTGEEVVRHLASNNTLTFLSIYLDSYEEEKPDFDKAFAALADNQSVTKLDLWLENCNLNGIEKLSKNIFLKSVKLYAKQQNADTVRILASLPNLEECLFGHVTHESFPCLFSTRLRTLGLFFTNVGYDGMETLSNLSTLTNLELKFCRLPDKAVIFLLKLKALEILTLVGNGIGDEGLAYIAQHSNITDLHFGEPNITCQGMEFLFKRKKTGLRSFHLDGSLKNTGGNDLWTLIFSDCSLTSLTLYKCDLHYQGAVFVLENKNLTELNLPDNHYLGDQWMSYLSTSNITSLDLMNCQIGDKGATVLASMPKLKRAVLSQNPRIGLFGIMALAFSASLRQLNFEHTIPIDETTQRLELLFLLGNQMLSYCPFTIPVRNIPRLGNELLVQLGGRNFRLRNEERSAVRLAVSKFLLNVLTDIVLEYAEEDYRPYRWQFFNEQLTPQTRGELQQKLPQIVQHFTDLANGCKRW